jgi:hypothetical protein
MDVIHGLRGHQWIARLLDRLHDMRAREVGAGCHEARHDGVGRVVLGAPHDGAARNRGAFVERPAPGVTEATIEAATLGLPILV